MLSDTFEPIGDPLRIKNVKKVLLKQFWIRKCQLISFEPIGDQKMTKKYFNNRFGSENVN